MSHFRGCSIILTILLPIACMSFWGAAAGQDHRTVFQKCDKNRDRHLSLREYLTLGEGRSKSTLRVLNAAFRVRDSIERDGRLSREEFGCTAKRDKSPTYGGPGDGFLQYPFHKEVADVDEYSEEIEVVVLSGTNEDFDYSYYAKIFDHSPNSSEAPDNPISILGQLTPLDWDMGDGHWSGFVPSCRHSTDYAEMGATENDNFLVTWELKVNVMTEETTWMKRETRFYGHTMYYFEP